MARTNKKKAALLFIDGIDVSSPGEYIDASSVTNSVNFDLDRKLIVKRTGTTQLGDVIGGTGVEIMNGTEFNREGTLYNVRIGLDKIERYNVGTSAWVDVTGTDLNGTTADLVSIATPLLSGKRILTFTNNVDVIRKWTATDNTEALGGTPPVAKFVQEYKTYLVAANVGGGTDISQRVQWSDTADPENWSTGNSGSVDLIEDGEDITGMGLFGDYLCIHKDKSIYLGYLSSSTDIFRFVRKSTGVGTVANNSLQELPSGEQIFLAKDGIRIFNGISAPLIEAPINDEIRDSLNSQYAFKAWSVLVKEKDEVWIGIPIGSQEVGETVYKFNYKSRVLYKDSRTNANAAWLGSASSSVSWDEMVGSWDDNLERWNGSGLSEGAEQINISTNLGFTSKVDLNALADSGTTITAFLDTKIFQDTTINLARWKVMQLWAKGSSVKIEYSTDDGDTWSEVSNSPVTLTSSFPSGTSPIMLYFDVFSAQIKFRFTNSGADETLAIKQFVVGYSSRESIT